MNPWLVAGLVVGGLFLFGSKSDDKAAADKAAADKAAADKAAADKAAADKAAADKAAADALTAAEEAKAKAEAEKLSVSDKGALGDKKAPGDSMIDGGKKGPGTIDKSATDPTMPSIPIMVKPSPCLDLPIIAFAFKYQSVWPSQNGKQIGSFVSSYLLKNMKATKSDFDLIIKMLDAEANMRDLLSESASGTKSIRDLSSCLAKEKVSRFGG